VALPKPQTLNLKHQTPNPKTCVGAPVHRLEGPLSKLRFARSRLGSQQSRPAPGLGFQVKIRKNLSSCSICARQRSGWHVGSAAALTCISAPVDRFEGPLSKLLLALVRHAILLRPFTCSCGAGFDIGGDVAREPKTPHHPPRPPPLHLLLVNLFSCSPFTRSRPSPSCSLSPPPSPPARSRPPSFNCSFGAGLDIGGGVARVPQMSKGGGGGGGGRDTPFWRGEGYGFAEECRGGRPTCSKGESFMGSPR